MSYKAKLHGTDTFRTRSYSTDATEAKGTFPSLITGGVCVYSPRAYCSKGLMRDNDW